MNKTLNQCSVRIPKILHQRVKLQAYKRGWTIQEFLIYLIENDFLNGDLKCGNF